MVRRLRRAGAVLCAKLAMVELAGGMGYRQAFATFSGPGRTPWDPTRWSGGSSSGPAAAVAAGLVPFAIGSETWGSIQYPAAFCGVTGLRPTFGRVSRHGAMALSPTMDKIGPLARSAEDCGLVLAAIAGPDPGDPSAIGRRFAPPAGRPVRRYRVGILRGTLERTQPEVRRNFEASLDVLREIADIEEDLELPDYPWDAMAGLVLDAEAASAFEPLVPERSGQPAHRRPRIGSAATRARWCWRGTTCARSGSGVPPAAALDRLLARVDALAAPTLPTVAWPVDVSLDQAYPEFPGGTSVAGAANLCGIPALFLMNGTGEAGLPTSLQLTGRAQSEATLLEIGMHYQARTKFHRRRPPGL